MVAEILQRLRNKGVVLTHPEDMPTLPLSSITVGEVMEECLTRTANAEYLVSTYLFNSGGLLVYTPAKNESITFSK